MKTLEEVARESGSTEEALDSLHAAGASPIYAIKALRNGRDLSLGDAKTKLMESPAWHAEAAAANRLHEQLDKLLEEDDNV